MIDVSVSRHMGLFAVARLAERHGVRVRLRAGSPQGLTALVWLPDSLIERGTRPYGAWAQPRCRRSSRLPRQPDDRPSQHPPCAPLRMASQRTTGADAVDAASGPQPPGGHAHDGAGPRETVPGSRPATSSWFTSVGRPQLLRPGTAADGHPADSSPGRRPQTAGARWGAGTDGWAEGTHAAQIIADPVRGDHTVAGLPVRVPRANLIPDLRAAAARPAAAWPALRQMVARRRRRPRRGRSDHLSWLAAA